MEKKTYVIMNDYHEYFCGFSTFGPIFSKDIKEAKKYDSWYSHECLDDSNAIEEPTLPKEINIKKEK